MTTTTIIVKPRSKTIASFQYPNSGRIKIKFASNLPVDLFIVPGSAAAETIRSIESATSLGALVYSNRVSMFDQPIALPQYWQLHGWKLVVGNPTSQEAAISYEVSEGL